MKEMIELGVFGLAVLVCLVSSRWDLATLAFCIPFIQWFPQTPIPLVNLLNLLLLPILVRALMAGPSPPGAGRRDPILVPAVIFLACFFFSWLRVRLRTDLPTEFVMEGGQEENLITLKEVFTDFLLYLCARRLTRDPHALRRAFAGVVAGDLFEASTGAREFLFSGNFRATGHFSQPNKLGHFLAAHLMIPFGFTLGGRRKFILYAIPGVVITCLGLMGAVSRGALVAAGVSMALVALLARSPWVVVIAAMLGTSSWWLPEKVLSRFQETVVEGAGGEEGGFSIDTEHEGRVLIWGPGIRMAGSNPLGVGLGQFPYNLMKYGYQSNKLRQAHNIYLEVATEQGWLALFAHVWIWLAICAASLQVARASPGSFEGCIGLSMLGITVSFMTSGFFGHAFYTNNLSGTFWLLAGMTANLRDAIPAATAMRASTGPRIAPGEGRPNLVPAR